MIPVYSSLLVCVLPIPSAHEAAGATGIRHSPPSFDSGALRGEVANVCLDVIASEAKQSILSLRRDGLLRFARNDGLPAEITVTTIAGLCL